MFRSNRLFPIVAGVAAALSWPNARAELLKTVLPNPPAAVPVPSALATAASGQHLPLAVEAAEFDGGPARIGDAIAALVVLKEGAVHQYWIVGLQLARATPAEVAAHPPKPQTMTSAAGRTYNFATGGAVAVDVLTLGPVGAGARQEPELKRSRAFVSPDLLAIGLDQSCRAMLKLGAEHKADTGPARALSEEDERAVLGFFPALMTFFQTAQKSAGLRDILWNLVEKPSLWSFLKKRGFDLGLQLGDDSIAVATLPGWTGPALPQYRMSFELKFNSTPAVECSLFVTQPAPPLLTTAGIVGIVAQPPHNPNKQLDIRIVGIRRGHGEPVSKLNAAGPSRLTAVRSTER